MIHDQTHYTPNVSFEQFIRNEYSCFNLHTLLNKSYAQYFKRFSNLNSITLVRKQNYFKNKNLHIYIWTAIHIKSVYFFGNCTHFLKVDNNHLKVYKDQIVSYSSNIPKF